MHTAGGTVGVDGDAEGHAAALDDAAAELAREGDGGLVGFWGQDIDQTLPINILSLN
ncbi:hypothetical protein [Rhodocyclus purpureus]|uniref:hypothetical protein n=1 Tax=Rhodocyclus purpureus TaxID=1067 RepID=UPI00191208B8|nr:hypothetical protein [Rhodocyclus purpureus]